MYDILAESVELSGLLNFANSAINSVIRNSLSSLISFITIGERERWRDLETEGIDDF